MTPTLDQVKALFQSLNIEGPPNGGPIHLDLYQKLMDKAEREFGKAFVSFFMDCFMPEGEPICPGYEDSLSHYQFDAGSWEDFERDLIEWWDHTVQ